MICCICQRELPNKWAVARRETVDGEVRCYCHLHANEDFRSKTAPQAPDAKGDQMDEPKRAVSAAQEQEIVENASGERVKSAWSACASLAGKLGGGVKALWAKIHPDRSPSAMLAALNESQAENHARLEAVKPKLDGVYREIVAKKKDYQAAAPVRQRLLKIELQTLVARYKGLEREFTILCENERSIETVKGRFLEVLAYGMRGGLDAGMVDRLAADIDKKADEAEFVQDALGDLDRAGRRRERDPDDFDAELAGFDGELGLAEAEADANQPEVNSQERENENEITEIIDPVHGDGSVADVERGNPA